MLPDFDPALLQHAWPVPQHMGELHPYETVLVLLIAFGPFLVIGLLVRRERRRTGQDDVTDASRPASPAPREPPRRAPARTDRP